MYIDGVFSGGGIKGFALVGAYKAIENKGFRFKRVAGTSAGSLVAGLIAAGYTSDEIFQLVDELELEDLLDPRHAIASFPVARWLFLYWRLGLYKGNKFEEWIESKLADKGVRTFADLEPQALRIIASDITNGRMIVIPDDLRMYGIDPRYFSVAKAIRMSCSLPYFFEPVKLKNGQFPSVVVDGGVLSNFPMWLFDKENVKKVRPVLGIKLSHHLNERPKKKVRNAIELFEALFVTMKEAHDSRYISRKHEKNIIFIPTDGILTTEFDLSDEKKEKLFQLGYNKANHFFSRWGY